MKIEIKKIVKPLWLREYAPEYGDTKLDVWVNPPKSVLEKHTELMEQAASLRNQLQAALKLGGDAATERIKEIGAELAEIGKAMVNWLAEIWSQGSEETKVSADDLELFILDCEENDPALYAWLLGQTLEMIRQHRAMQKKS